MASTPHKGKFLCAKEAYEEFNTLEDNPFKTLFIQ
jgi:hypothetical protein